MMAKYFWSKSCSFGMYSILFTNIMKTVLCRIHEHHTTRLDKAVVICLNDKIEIIPKTVFTTTSAIHYALFYLSVQLALQLVKWH